MTEMSHVRVISDPLSASDLAAFYDEIHFCLNAQQECLNRIEARLAVLEVVLIHTEEKVDEVLAEEAEEVAEEGESEESEEAAEEAEEAAEEAEEVTDVDVIEVEESPEEAAPVVHTVSVPTAALPFRR